MVHVEGRGKRAVGVELVQDISEISSPIEGFLRRHRHRAKTLLEDGSRTDVYVVDYVDRDPGQRHAAAIAIYSDPEAGQGAEDARVLLRRQVRYAMYVMTGHALCTEVVAGLIEGRETPEETALREIREETAILADAANIRRLGEPYFVLPGTMTEMIYPIAARVPREAIEASAQAELSGDGSPLEEGAEIVVLTLGEALALCDRPSDPSKRCLHVADAKTEIVLRRLERELRQK